MNGIYCTLFHLLLKKVHLFHKGLLGATSVSNILGVEDTESNKTDRTHAFVEINILGSYKQSVKYICQMERNAMGKKSIVMRVLVG